MKLKEEVNPLLLLLFHLMVWIYTAITFLPCYLVSWFSVPEAGFCGSEEERAKRAKARSVMGHPEGPYRALSATKTLATSLHPGVDTLDKMFEFAATRFPHRDCLGTRVVITPCRWFLVSTPGAPTTRPSQQRPSWAAAWHRWVRSQKAT